MYLILMYPLNRVMPFQSIVIKRYYYSILLNIILDVIRERFDKF